MKKVVFTNFQGAGDILMLTAAIRDLHECHPDKFITDVRTSHPELWENNPYLTPLADDDPEVEVIPCHYPLIQHSNERPVHFLQGFTDYIGERLNVRIVPLQFKGDIYLTDTERAHPSPVEEHFAYSGPYWIVIAGGKLDYTIKWWSRDRFQAIINHFQPEIRFVQVGAAEHCHSGLEKVFDLRGKTSLRDLIRLVYHSAGVLCPVTFLMHLAAAVEMPGEDWPARPCVVVAGGREPPHWEAYPTHQFVHTVGALDCCRTGGCWRSRTVPLGDNDIKDRPEQLCVDVVDALPRCMDMITPEAVISRMSYYLSF